MDLKEYKYIILIQTIKQPGDQLIAEASLGWPPFKLVGKNYQYFYNENIFTNILQ